MFKDCSTQVSSTNFAHFVSDVTPSLGALNLPPEHMLDLSVLLLDLEIWLWDLFLWASEVHRYVFLVTFSQWNILLNKSLANAHAF